MVASAAAIRSRLAAIWAFGAADFLGHPVDAAVDFQQLGLDVFRFGRGRAVLAPERLHSALEPGQSFAQPPPVDLADLGPQLLQPVGVFLVAAGLAGLGANAAEPVLDLVDDVGEPQQVLLDAFQPAEGLDLADLEAADAGRLLEDHPPVLRRRLQEHVDLALLDHAVGLGAHAGAREQVADVAEPGRAAVDQVLALAAAIDAAGDVDLGGVDRQLALGVVEASA